ncbi:phage virion morphogenesis protein [Streptomyces cinereoruber]|uniref:phage virion morphogenesis protein n=1 Tax=Streptomyces cinereoruber TaxID=67260 RepID=UPI003635ABBD
MAGQSITVTVTGASELAGRLRKFGASILDLSDSMNQSGQYLKGFFSGEVFASRGGVIGKPWAPLSSAYAADKAQQYPGRPPLIRTGTMNRSFKHRAGRSTAEVWNDAWYFHFHQSGTRKMPARVMMDVDEKRALRIAGFIEADITSKMRAIDV